MLDGSNPTPGCTSSVSAAAACVARTASSFWNSLSQKASEAKKAAIQVEEKIRDADRANPFRNGGLPPATTPRSTWRP